MDPLRRQLTDPDIERLLKAIERIRILDRQFPAQVLSSLLYIASHDNCHKQALEEDLDITTASSSRNTDWLSEYHRLRKPGLGLIIKEEDPGNGRRQQLKLSPKGRRLIQQIKEDLYGPKDSGVTEE
jgi:DNA-binding MarR family transcriptional regulator